jgi:hypothetical protein
MCTVNVIDYWVSRRYTTRDATQFRNAGPLTPRHKSTVCGDDENAPTNLGTRPGRRCWTAVRNRRTGPRRAPPKGTYYAALRPLTGAAKYAWGARAR